MMSTHPWKHGWSFWFCLVLAIGCLASSGCALWDRQAPQPEARKSPDWTDGLRTPGPKGEQLGLDPRAREIERHVGFE
jgi:hypothetical protein